MILFGVSITFGFIFYEVDSLDLAKKRGVGAFSRPTGKIRTPMAQLKDPPLSESLGLRSFGIVAMARILFLQFFLQLCWTKTRQYSFFFSESNLYHVTLWPRLQVYRQISRKC